jgi:hypothetical protein
MIIGLAHAVNRALAAALTSCLFASFSFAAYVPEQALAGFTLTGGSNDAGASIGTENFRLAAGKPESSAGIGPRLNQMHPEPMRTSPAHRVDRSRKARPRVSLLVAVQKTTAHRSKDTVASARAENLSTVAELVRLRGIEDRYFKNKAENLGRRISKRSDGSGTIIKFAYPKTGAEFLEALVAASRLGPLVNLVIYGHSAFTGLYMLEDRGFYKTVRDTAKGSALIEGAIADRRHKLRVLGARDLGDLKALVRRGKIRFATGAVVVFAGCSAAGETDIEPLGMASQTAKITGAVVFGSIGVTDESMADLMGTLADGEYSRGTWVRFNKGARPRKLNGNVLDPLEQLKLD